MSEECIVCKRVSPIFVFKYLHKIFDDLLLDKRIIHEIGIEIIEIINLVDKKDRFFVGGIGKKSLLSGLVYIIARKYGSMITQRTLSEGFSLTETVIRNSYYRWKSELKKIDYDFNKKGIWVFYL